MKPNFNNSSDIKGLRFFTKEICPYYCIVCYTQKRLRRGEHSKDRPIISTEDIFSVNLICRSLMCVLINQFGLKLKQHNRNEIEPHWAPGPSFPGFGSNTVRFSWPRVTGQVHLGHHSLPSARQFCQRPQSRHYTLPRNNLLCPLNWGAYSVDSIKHTVLLKVLSLLSVLFY